MSARLFPATLALLAGFALAGPVLAADPPADPAPRPR
jgi:hypothetical protein